MMDYGWGMMGGFGFIWMLLFWGVLIALAVWLISQLFPSAPSGSGQAGPSAREILKRRYASGELTEEQYQQMRQQIEGG